MPKPLDVACGACAQQPGEQCNGQPPFPPIDSELGVHFERIEAAKFISAVEEGCAPELGHVPSSAEFRKAVLSIGLF